MAVLRLKPKLRPLSRPRVHGSPLYGYGYNPSWPSILSVAHDTSNGGRLFVVTDRPVILVGGAVSLPFAVAGLSVEEGVAVSPVKFRLWMNGPVPAGSAWTWGADAPPGGELVDPITGNPLNASSGDCADVPGAYTPLPPASMVAAFAEGNTAQLTFDRPVVLTGDPVDGAILFDGVQPDSVAGSGSPEVLTFVTPNAIGPGSTWAISSQPSYVVTPIANPAGGTF